METISINTSLAGVAIIFIFFGGAIAGHQFGLIREKRREFNLVARALRDELAHAFNPTLLQYPNLSSEQKKLIFSMMSPFHRQVFGKAYTIYSESINTAAASDVHLIEKHFRKVLEHLRDK
jgi:ABC-type uncharacterized transport system permease subunit